MKAVAVIPGKPNSIHLREVPRPHVGQIPDGRGVLVRVLRVGVDGTDREINQAEYGAVPPGDDYLIIGHESLGVVVETGAAAHEFHPGDLVVATVRRPGHSFYDKIGLQDMTTDDVYYERGINLRHGYLTEYYVESPDYLVRVPASCREVGVLLEPLSVAEKGIAQAFEIQRRMKLWQPRRAAVMGAGTLGLLATLALRLRNLEVTTFGLKEPPYYNSERIVELGARYVSTKREPVRGPFDLIFEATGNSGVVFEAAQALAKNGVLVLSSITGGDRRLEIPADKINLDFVLGNKLMFGTVNAHRDHFEMGAIDLERGVAEYPGWLDKLLTHRVEGLENYAEMMRLLLEGQGVIKVCVEVARP
ncbi:MAG TPA: glucose 1-dehydrogenase [Candidatus Polarisedimenticolaceae bacterium]|nr:glucose 1-dehydrogenase [Candidatus Polarisedimenticolaceae bacterium]